MTDQIGRRKRGSVSLIELLSVVAMVLILVMIAVPFPYASRNRWLPTSHTALGRGNAAVDAKSADTIESTSAGKAASAGYASQGSPAEVRTVGKREFCADMPGVVRFSTTGHCRNGKFLTNAQLRHEQQKP